MEIKVSVQSWKSGPVKSSFVLLKLIFQRESPKSCKGSEHYPIAVFNVLIDIASCPHIFCQEKMFEDNTENRDFCRILLKLDVRNSICTERSFLILAHKRISEWKREGSFCLSTVFTGCLENKTFPPRSLESESFPTIYSNVHFCNVHLRCSFTPNLHEHLLLCCLSVIMYINIFSSVLCYNFSW